MGLGPGRDRGGPVRRLTKLRGCSCRPTVQGACRFRTSEQVSSGRVLWGGGALKSFQVQLSPLPKAAESGRGLGVC